MQFMLLMIKIVNLLMKKPTKSMNILSALKQEIKKQEKILLKDSILKLFILSTIGCLWIMVSFMHNCSLYKDKFSYAT